MAQRKRSIDITDHRQTKKAIVDLTSISTNCFTQFEDLSNELLFEVFDFLDFHHVYQAFSNLNIRFQKLLHDPHFPIKIDLSSISKSALERYHSDIILPHPYRVQSVQLSNPLIIDRVFSSTSDVFKFTGLENLHLRNIESDYLESLLVHLICLPSLTSLTVKCGNDAENKNILYPQIFCLSKLKYCKLSIDGTAIFRSPSTETSELSSIECLTIISSCHVDELQSILTYLPRIRRLSVDYVHGYGGKQMKFHPSMLNNLTHVSLNVDEINCRKFRSIAKHWFPQVQVLYISTNSNRTYLDAKKWENFISGHLPQLRIFDIEYEHSDNRNDRIDYDILMNQFRTPFWFQHQWFFTSRLSRNGDHDHFVFYSTNPYRRKHYLVGAGTHESNSNHCEEGSINSVRHVDIEDEEMMINCKNNFPNATDLTVRYHSLTEGQYSLPAILARILPLKQLTYLSVHCANIRFEVVVHLLHFLPHLDTLVLFFPRSIRNIDFVSIEQNATFRRVSESNKIRKMIIKSHCTYEQLKLLVNLCPRLQQLSLQMYQDALKLALRFLLSKTDEHTCQLHSLCITYIRLSSQFEEVKTLLEAENLAHVSVTEVSEFTLSNIYLWW